MLPAAIRRVTVDWKTQTGATRSEYVDDDTLNKLAIDP